MTEQTEAVSEKTEEIAPVASVPAPAVAKEVAAPEPEKQHVERTGWRKIFPQVVVDNATRISNAGLLIFTSIMLYSGYRGKQISQKIYDKQIDLLKEAGFKGESLVARTAELVKKEIIVKPNWHKMRLVYLGTACTSFAFGAFFKRKEEKTEDLARYEQMSLPAYLAERTKEAFNPTEHSRQTVGVLSGVAGLFAIVSALTQPGGVHKSERFAGGLLAAGGFLLAYIPGAALAQKAFTACWLARTPAIVTGIKESTVDVPAFKHPMIAEMKKTPAFFEGMQKAYTEGHPEKVFFNAFSVQRKAGQAAKAYDASFGKLPMPFKRMDIAYPIGQVGNLVSAIIGIAGKKAAPKYVAKVEPVAFVAADDLAPTAPTNVPNPTVHTVHKEAATLQAAPEQLQAARTA